MPNLSAQTPIAFFCAEYGLDSRLPIYAGGLGILAGDILKESADQRLPLAAIGLLYRGEGAAQRITEHGQQEEVDVAVDPLALGLEPVFLDEMPLFIKVHLTQVDVWVRCWQKKIGETVTLYLLDTDTDQNHVSERSICAGLYSGTEEALIKQQLILGVGGVKLLHALNLHPTVYHVNEGRPAFLHWQLIRSFMDEHGIGYEEARQLARSKTVYTNHTLVGAGNQSYDLDLIKAFSAYYAEKMGISVETLVEPGVKEDRFNVTEFALNVARKVSAVSQLHWQLCQEAWPDFDWVGITNGVHAPTWQAAEVRAAGSEPQALWSAHLQQKETLARYVQEQTGYSYDPQRLVLTWARRITGYKQLQQLFSDVEHLKKIMSLPGREVQLLVAGKAHAYDTASKQLVEEVIGYFQQELAGLALYIPNYNIELAQHLVAGSDVWLNTPELGKEASGTSGMKAISNGVLQCTVSDGWAAEVAWQGIGWQLDADLVAESLYTTLKNEIIPLYFERNEVGLPEDWVERMKKSQSLVERFTAGQMMREYLEKLYG
jgi:glucan phosphorylase